LFFSIIALQEEDAVVGPLADGTALVLKYTWYDALLDYPVMNSNNNSISSNSNSNNNSNSSNNSNAVDGARKRTTTPAGA
jgi:hypothetical protein